MVEHCEEGDLRDGLDLVDETDSIAEVAAAEEEPTFDPDLSSLKICPSRKEWESCVISSSMMI